MADFTSKATGNWDAEGQTTWNEAGHPGAGDTVTIQNGHTVTLDSATSCTTLTIDAGGTLTDATNNQGIDVSGVTTVNGTLTCGTAAMAFGSGLADNYGVEVGDGGTFTGGSGAHTIWALRTNNSTVTLTSGTTTITGYNDFGGNHYSVVWIDTAIDANGGTVTFTHATDTQELWCAAHTARSLYNVTVNKAAGALRWGDNAGFALTIAGALTVTSGAFNLWDGTDSTNISLTVTGATDITGTLDGKAATTTLTGNATIQGAGTFTASSGTTNIGGNFDNSNGGTFTHSSGSVVFNGTNQEIDGSTTWNNLDKHVASAAYLEIDNTSTQTVVGELNLYGVSGDRLTIRSDSAGDAFNLTLTGTKGTIQYLDVKDSDASGSDADVKPINPSGSEDSGGNTDWFVDFTPQVIITMTD